MLLRLTVVDVVAKRARSTDPSMQPARFTQVVTQCADEHRNHHGDAINRGLLILASYFIKQLRHVAFPCSSVPRYSLTLHF